MFDPEEANPAAPVVHRNIGQPVSTATAEKYMLLCMHVLVFGLHLTVSNCSLPCAVYSTLRFVKRFMDNYDQYKKFPYRHHPGKYEEFQNFDKVCCETHVESLLWCASDRDYFSGIP